MSCRRCGNSHPRCKCPPGATGATGVGGDPGATGATGAPSPTPTSTGAFKFSGRTPTTTGGQQTSYLADSGSNILTVRPAYPIAENIRARVMAVNLTSPVDEGVTVEVRLLRNGIVLAALSVTYIGPETGIKLTPLVPTLFTAGQTIDVEVVTTAAVENNLNVSATVSFGPP